MSRRPYKHSYITMRFLLPALLLTSGLGAAQVKINEVRLGEAGPDVNEFFELRVTPGTSLAGLSYVVLGANAVDGWGVIEVVVTLPAIVPSDPYYLVAESTMTLATPDLVAVLGFDDQQSSAHLLVSGFTGAVGQDLDVGDDGVLDFTPWTEKIEGFAFLFGSDPFTTVYGNSVVGIDFIPGSPILHAGRAGGIFLDLLPEGTQSDTPGEENGTGVQWWPWCWPALPNGSGHGAELRCSTSAAPGSDLHLEVTRGEEGSLGYFLVGTGNGAYNPLQISNGLLCLDTSPGNGLGRYNVANTEYNSIGLFQGGVLHNFVGTSSTGTGFDVPRSLPLAGNSDILVGQTFYFQCWYREQGQNPSSNFSNMVGVLF